MPTFDPDILPTLTRERFAHLAAADITVEPLAQDGSDRVYFRLRLSPHAPPAPAPSPAPAGITSMLVMRFGVERVENLSFTPVSLLLRSLGIACPEIYSHDDARHLVWLEDLGNRDLYALRDESWKAVRRPLYEAALREVARLHDVSADAFAASADARRLRLQPPFDTALYRWEQDYFFQNFVANFSDLDADAARAIREDASLADLAAGLAALPRALVHRDLQSRNVLVRGDRVYLIDYQGLRLGLPEYDLASLLYDPYVGIPPGAREDLLDFYASLRRNPPPAGAGRDRLLKCAAQRLMQALGAYGFLGLVKQKRHFLDSIQPAVQNLLAVINQLPALRSLEPALHLKKNHPDLP